MKQLVPATKQARWTRAEPGREKRKIWAAVNDWLIQASVSPSAYR
ncbi:hypothetical protein [Paenibacillus sp. NEAU-GSW1]|nr:hypothetical protein [Paenibacillus sp. NEAU-GSW1]